MMDSDCWSSISELLSIVDHNKRPDVEAADCFGALHVVLFGDFKQLPPATSKPPFIVLPSVFEAFDFRVLRQNRRVVNDPARKAEIESFHEVLADISWGRDTSAVRAFLTRAYVRGSAVGCAEHAELEGSTAVFTKRRLF